MNIVDSLSFVNTKKSLTFMGGGAFIGGKQNKDFIVVAELALPIVEQARPPQEADVLKWKGARGGGSTGFKGSG